MASSHSLSVDMHEDPMKDVGRQGYSDDIQGIAFQFDSMNRSAMRHRSISGNEV